MTAILQKRILSFIYPDNEFVEFELEINAVKNAAGFSKYLVSTMNDIMLFHQNSPSDTNPIKSGQAAWWLQKETLIFNQTFMYAYMA